jgi:hypothetical protein
MTACLQTAKAPDISGLIKNLGDDDFNTRTSAMRKIKSYGPAVVDQLKKAADSPDAETATRVAALLKSLGSGQKSSSARRLMAIRTLGELKDPKALDVLRGLEKSKEPFFAEYAARSIAAVEGKPYNRSHVTVKELDEDLALLPANCGMVGQARLRLADGVKYSDMIEQLKAVIPEPQREQVASQIHGQLLKTIDQIGNVRIDAVTMGLADKIGPQDGFVVFIARGHYDREAVASLLKSTPFSMTPEEIDGRSVFSAPRGNPQIVLLSDTRLALIAGPPGQQVFTARQLVANLKAGDQKTLPSNEAMMNLVKQVDRETSEVWAVCNVTEGYPLEAPFNTFKSVILTLGAEKDTMRGKLVAVGADAEEVARAVDMTDAVLGQALGEAKQQATQLPFMQPLVGVLESIEHTVEGRAVTVTARVENAGKVLMIPMLMTGALRRQTGQARPFPPPPNAVPQKGF